MTTLNAWTGADVSHALRIATRWEEGMAHPDPLDAVRSASPPLDALLAHAPVTLYVCQPAGGFPVTFVSPTVTELLGHLPDAFRERPGFWIDHIHPEDRDAILQDRRALVPGETLLRKYRFRCADGGWKWIRDRARLVGVPGQEEIVGAWNDITELIGAEETLRNSEAKHRFLLDHINAGVLVYAANGSIVYANRHAEVLLGKTAQQLSELAPDALAATWLDEEGNALPPAAWPAARATRERRVLENQMVGLQRARGDEPSWVVVNAFPDLGIHGRVREVVVTLLDITERVRSQRQIHHLAHYDALTDLPNRTLIQQRIDQALERAQAIGGRVAVLFVDLNDFKHVNDTLGHATGDVLLRQVAQRLCSGVRETDTVGRLGGDEFVIVLPGAHAHAAAGVAQKIGALIDAPFEIEGQVVAVQASIGISVYPEDGADRLALTRNADAAMYQAKESGRGHRFFDSGMGSRIEHHYGLEHELRLALEAGQFELHYQPQIDLRSGQSSGLEALVRWRHPLRGLISPMEFIPVAEKSRLIQPLGKWIIAQACRDIRHWADQGLPHQHVALNLSLRQLQEQHFLERFIAIVEGCGVPLACLEWEITESTMMRHPDVVLAFMRGCRDRGVRFSIDDFGTGYSSLGSLKDLPVDKVKIDRAFIHGVEHDRGVQVILASVVSMVRRLGLAVVAEGVEEREQLRYLQNVDCDAVQGYFFSKPLDRDGMTAFLLSESEQRQSPVRSERYGHALVGDGRVQFAV